MDLKEAQNEAVTMVDRIDEKFSGKHDIDTTIIHLMEEFGEVARQIYNKKIGRDETNIENLKEEFGDVFILLSKLADNYDISLEECVALKFDMLRKRHRL